MKSFTNRLRFVSNRNRPFANHPQQQHRRTLSTHNNKPSEGWKIARYPQMSRPQTLYPAVFAQSRAGARRKRQKIVANKKARSFSASGFNPEYQPVEPITFTEEALQNPLYMVSSCTSLVHPHKKNMGEDAHFIANDGTAIGVADGIGGWSQYNVDSGMYSRELMSHALHCFENDVTQDPMQALELAYQKSRSLGSCTACILSIKANILEAAHIGDSGFLIIRRNSSSEDTDTCCASGECRSSERLNSDVRGWKVVYQSVEQQHFFNCPVQLGTKCRDKPSDAVTTQTKVQAGDIIISATDGLFDNLFQNDIFAIINKIPGPVLPCSSADDGKAGEKAVATWLEAVSTTLGREASEAASSMTRRSPFETNARKHGFVFEGGKLDDITVVVSLVTCKNRA